MTTEKTEETIVELTEDQKAFKLIARVCSLFKGNLQEHQAIQQALNVLKPIENKLN